MKVLVIGGVAAGTKAAGKIKKRRPFCRSNDRDKRQGYFLCRLRSAVLCGDVIPDKEQLIVNTPAKFAARQE